MTLPSVINNSRNKQLEAGLKRAYSVIGQALDMYQAQNGERIKKGEVDVQKLKGFIMPYFKVIEDCGFGSQQLSACIPNLGTGNEQNSTTYKNYTGTSYITLRNFDDGQFVIMDGALILIENADAYDINGQALYISVDVNGYNKNPNRLGQDLFMFQIDEKGTLLPMGVNGTDYYSATDNYCSSTSTDSMNGAGCTYNALTDKNYFKNLPK